MLISLSVFYHQSSKCTVRTDKHSGPITDLQITVDKTMIITSSKDTTAKVNLVSCSSCVVCVLSRDKPTLGLSALAREPGFNPG